MYGTIPTRPFKIKSLFHGNIDMTKSIPFWGSIWLSYNTLLRTSNLPLELVLSFNNFNAAGSFPSAQFYDSA